MDSSNSVSKSQQCGVIYVITNNLNGKQYVGQTIDLTKRLSAHRKAGKPGIGKAIQKYGWRNFSVEVIEECENRDELNEREIFWIAKLNTKAPNGYNLTEGGDGNCGYVASEETRKKLSAAGRRRQVTAETRKKLSESQKGKIISEETRAKMSAVMKAKGIKPPPRTGKEPWNKGKNWSAETRKKLSESHLGNKVSEETRKKISATLKAKGIKPPSWKGRHHTEESLKKISLINKGKKMSAEQKAKISATLKARNAKKRKLKNKFIEGSLF